ncbi:MAG: hypothetical protein AAB518_04160, partial [Patescibacteria group bacterium]
KVFLFIAAIVAILAAGASALGVGPPATGKEMQFTASITPAAHLGGRLTDATTIAPSSSSAVLLDATLVSVETFTTMHSASPPTGTASNDSIASRLLSDEPATASAPKGHTPEGTYDVPDGIGLPTT